MQEINDSNLHFKEFRNNLEEIFLETLTDEEMERESNEKTKSEQHFRAFCFWDGYFLTMAKKYFAKKNLKLEEKYAFIKQAYLQGFSHCFYFKKDKLIEPELYQLFDEELLEEVIKRNDYHTLADLFQNNANKELYNLYRNNIGDNGYIPRNMIKQMQTPQYIDYRQEVPQNDFIDIFNTTYDDACVYERSVPKIIELGTLSNGIYLNQDNLISLAKNLYQWGPSSNLKTHKILRLYYDSITTGIVKDNVIPYDYNSSTLSNIKSQDDYHRTTRGTIKLRQRVIFKSCPPGFSYVLAHFNTAARSGEKMEELVKKLTLMNPEEERKIFIKKQYKR